MINHYHLDIYLYNLYKSVLLLRTTPWSGPAASPSLSLLLSFISRGSRSEYTDVTLLSRPHVRRHSYVLKVLKAHVLV